MPIRTTKPYVLPTDQADEFAQPDPQPDDSMSALHTFLGGQTLPSSRAASPTMRNNAQIALMKKHLGLPLEPSDLSFSQADLESAQAGEEADVRQQKHLDRMQMLQEFLSPEAKQQRQELSQTKIAEAVAPETVKGQYGLQGAQVHAQGGVEEARLRAQGLIEAAAMKAAATGPNAKLSAQELSSLDAIHGTQSLGEPLLQEFERRFPGIGTETGRAQHGSATDVLTAKFGKGWYSFGGMTENDDLMQKTAAIQAWAVRQLSSGRINRQMMDLINAHLPQPGYSPGANYDRLKRLLREVIPAQVQGLQATHSADPYAAVGAPSDNEWVTER